MQIVYGEKMKMMLKKVMNNIRKGMFLIKNLRKISGITPTYCNEAPSWQTMADIFKDDWASAFPSEYKIKAGKIEHFDKDMRMSWVNSCLLNGFNGLSVLELGPYEAYQTKKIIDFGAAKITSIESNDMNFLKCLIVKEIMGLKASFLYGDFIKFLKRSIIKYDVIIASTVYQLNFRILFIYVIIMTAIRRLSWQYDTE